MKKQPTHSHLKPITLLPYLVLLVVPVLLYFRTMGFEFIPSWDDGDYVIKNPYIRGFTAANLKVIFTEVHTNNYAPIHLLSYMVDYTFWGLDAKGYHLTNFLLHAVNSVVLFVFVKRITGRSGVSFAAALFFSVHPLNVENVAWVSERKTLLTTFFALFSLLYYDKFRRLGGGRFLTIALGLFVCAILSKPLAVILPLIVTAYELFIVQGVGLKRFVPIIFYYLISLVGASISIWAHVSTKAVEVENLTSEFLLGTVYPTMLMVFWKYIALVLFPFNLSGYYDTEVYSSWLTLPVVVALIAWIIVFVIILWRGNGQVKFWFFWFWIWLFPVSNIIPIAVYYADRYMYMPAVGLFVLLLLALEKVSGGTLEVTDSHGIVPNRNRAKISSRLIIWSVVVLVGVYFTYASNLRIPVWQDDVIFWEDTVEKSPGLAKTHWNLGYAYEMRGRLTEAEKEYIASIKIYPYPEVISNLKMLRYKAAYLKSRTRAHKETQ
jgi:hypothetical protein